MNLQCKLCPKECLIPPGKRGDCRGRVNIDGKLTSITYGRPCSVHIDPVEKKPLFHFLPGQSILSVAAAGCILHCKNCQNWQISQADPESVPSYQLNSKALIDLAKQENCPMIAYTYTDPVAFYEYTIDTSRIAEENGIKNVLVTSGYGNPAPLKELYRVSDAANIDLKFIRDDMYRNITTGTLKPVLDSILLAKKMNVWVELTNLVIPTLNDSDKDITDLCRWIFNYAGKDTPVHFSRFHPQYKMTDLPPTPESTLERCRQIAEKSGLEYVYIGNIWNNKYESTYSPSDGTLLVERSGYMVVKNLLDAQGRSPTDGHIIPGVWK